MKTEQLTDQLVGALYEGCKERTGAPVSQKTAPDGAPDDAPIRLKVAALKVLARTAGRTAGAPEPEKGRTRRRTACLYEHTGCAGKFHGLTLAELEAEAADDWQEIQRDPEQLEVFAHAIQTRRMRESGQRPAHYTKAAECTHCGPVWLWEGAPDIVMGCPWCFCTGGRQRVSTAAGGRGSMKISSL